MAKWESKRRNGGASGSVERLIVGGLFGDHHVVDVAFAQAAGGDPGEGGAFAELFEA
jgi:hypothetical protein